MVRHPIDETAPMMGHPIVLTEDAIQSDASSDTFQTVLTHAEVIP